MDHRVFQFATRGQYIKGKQCLAHCNLEQNMCLRSKQSSLFSFYALHSGGKLKDAVVHWANFYAIVAIFCSCKLAKYRKKYLVILSH